MVSPTLAMGLDNWVTPSTTKAAQFDLCNTRKKRKKRKKKPSIVPLQEIDSNSCLRL